MKKDKEDKPESQIYFGKYAQLMVAEEFKAIPIIHDPQKLKYAGEGFVSVEMTVRPNRAKKWGERVKLVKLYLQLDDLEQIEEALKALRAKKREFDER